MSDIEQMVNDVAGATRERIVRRFVGGEAVKWILEASPAFVEECLRQRIRHLEARLTNYECPECEDEIDVCICEQSEDEPL